MGNRFLVGLFSDAMNSKFGKFTGTYGILEYVLKLDHGSHLTRDALKSPNHKKHFDFFLGCI